jgi:hypothetical protein
VYFSKWPWSLSACISCIPMQCRYSRSINVLFMQKSSLLGCVRMLVVFFFGILHIFVMILLRALFIFLMFEFENGTPWYAYAFWF